MKKLLVLISIVFIGVSCTIKEDTPIVINLLSMKSEEKEKIKLLDESHPNLLNPSNSKEKINEVRLSWVKIHQELNVFLAKNNFNWGVKEPQVKLFSRFYFDKNGKVEVYAFRLFNEVSRNKEKEFVKLVHHFVNEISISIQRDESFAQCGKIALPNNNML